MSRDDRAQDKCFEDYLESWMSSQGFSIIAREPDTRLCNGKTPDFLVEYESRCWYVEALTIRAGPELTVTGQGWRDCFNSHADDNYSLFVTWQNGWRDSDRTPGKKEMNQAIQPVLGWLADLPHPPLSNETFCKEFSIVGHCVWIVAVANHQDPPLPFVGGWDPFYTSSSLLAKPQLADRVRKKQRKYRNALHPLIIAVKHSGLDDDLPDDYCTGQLHSSERRPNPCIAVLGFAWEHPDDKGLVLPVAYKNPYCDDQDFPSPLLRM